MGHAQPKKESKDYKKEGTDHLAQREGSSEETNVCGLRETRKYTYLGTRKEQVNCWVHILDSLVPRKKKKMLTIKVVQDSLRKYLD